MKMFDDIVSQLTARFSGNVTPEKPERGEPFIRAETAALREVAHFLKNDPEFSFDCLMLLSGVDYPEKHGFAVVYHLFSMSHRHRVVLKVFTPRDDPRVPTVSDIWPTADWHEREAYDLFGIVFEGHPNLKRILCPEDWEGHTLRKDYKEPAAYHGLPLLNSRENHDKRD